METQLRESFFDDDDLAGGNGVAERPERGDVSPWERREVLWRNEEGRRGIGEGSATSSEENSPEREVAIWKWGTGEIRGASI